MKKMFPKVNRVSEKNYLSEYSFYDDDDFVTFNLVNVNTERNEVMVAVSDRGKISVITYDLMSDKNGKYFEYRNCLNKIHLDDFEEVL